MSIVIRETMVKKMSLYTGIIHSLIFTVPMTMYYNPLRQKYNITQSVTLVNLRVLGIRFQAMFLVLQSVTSDTVLQYPGTQPGCDGSAGSHSGAGVDLYQPRLEILR